MLVVVLGSPDKPTLLEYLVYLVYQVQHTVYPVYQVYYTWYTTRLVQHLVYLLDLGFWSHIQVGFVTLPSVDS